MVNLYLLVQVLLKLQLQSLPYSLFSEDDFQGTDVECEHDAHAIAGDQGGGRQAAPL